MKPLISVIVAAYNASGTLETCVGSILAQTHQNVEVIIVDDVSRDNTVDVARGLMRDDARVQLVQRSANGGPGGARNSGLDAARGEWVAVVDADDTILPQRLEKMLAAAQAQQADIVFDNLNYISTRGTSLYLDPASDLFGPLALTRYIDSHLAASPDPVLGFLKPLIRRAPIEDNHIRYDPALRIGEDTMLILNLYAVGARVCVLRDAWYQYYRRPGSISYIFNTDAASVYNAKIEAFIAEHRDHLPAGNVASLERLLAYTRNRLKAKQLVQSLSVSNAVSVFAQARRDPDIYKLFRHYLYIDARSGLKRLLLSLRPGRNKTSGAQS